MVVMAKWQKITHLSLQTLNLYKTNKGTVVEITEINTGSEIGYYLQCSVYPW